MDDIFGQTLISIILSFISISMTSQTGNPTTFEYDPKIFLTRNAPTPWIP